MSAEEDQSERHEPRSVSCPVPLAHDRLDEAHYFLHRMTEKATYHRPNFFRYNTNAFLSALKAVDDMLLGEMKRVGQSAWLQKRRDELRTDPVLSRFRKGRNIVIHERAIVEASQIRTGLFRWNILKNAIEQEVRHDWSSDEILERIVKPHFIGWLLDEEHSEIGMQLGVYRLYLVKELSDTEDAVAASWRALARMSALVSAAHQLLGSEWPSYEERGNQAELHDAEAVCLLLESDLDPEAIERWGWSALWDDDQNTS